MNDEIQKRLEKELKTAIETAGRAIEYRDEEHRKKMARIRERIVRSAEETGMFKVGVGSAITASILGFIVLLNEGVAFLPDPVKWMTFGGTIAFLSVCWVVPFIEHFVTEGQDNE